MCASNSSSARRPSGEMKAAATRARPEAKQATRQPGTGLPSRESVSSRSEYAVATRVSPATWSGSKTGPPTWASNTGSG